jgi:hypothetical protein
MCSGKDGNEDDIVFLVLPDFRDGVMDDIMLILLGAVKLTLVLVVDEGGV